MHPNPTQKALWYIEAHLADDLTLDAIAKAGGLSRFGMEKAFAAATGMAVMRYVRARRLSVAAVRLGAGGLLTLALDAGYGSHEAFTRAFRDRFGIPPDQARQRGVPATLLQEPLRMDRIVATPITPDRFEEGRTLRLAGFGDTFAHDKTGGIPALWQRLAPFLGNTPGEVGGLAYGVCGPADQPGQFTYFAGSEIAPDADYPAELQRLTVARQRYAVFLHRDHIATIRTTVSSIFNSWLPASGLAAARAPFYERYDARFHPPTGTGGVEIWFPVRPTGVMPAQPSTSG